MGVIDRPIGLVPAASVPPGEDQALLLQAATDEVQDKGFIVATLDNAGQLGAQWFAVADDLRAGLLRCRDDAYRSQPL